MRKSFTAAEMRHIKECRYCRERIARKRGPAVVRFIETYTNEDTDGEGTRSHVRLSRAEKIKRLRARLAELEAEDEDERRTDEDEGRRAGVDDEPERVDVGSKGARYPPYWSAD
jgi:hypothetical protein